MSARLRRLYADWQKIQDEFTGHPYIQVRPIAGDPPERYEVIFRVKGLRWDPNLNRPVETDYHRADIYLHQDYPREKPKCVLTTDIFHPNFGSYICIGDHWAAGETLVDVIIQIGEMIQYQSYNPKSPLNALAAQWARENEHLFPIGNADLYQEEVALTLGDAHEIEPSPAQQPDADTELDITLGDAHRAPDAPTRPAEPAPARPGAETPSQPPGPAAEDESDLEIELA
ncbi:MAG: ubiquitin-conjugating enzyme E2 [Armatimonadota bacterium]